MKNLRSIIIGVLIALVIAAGLIGIKITQFKSMGDAAAKQVMPPTPINSITVRRVTWQPRIFSVGTVTPVQGTELKAEAEGVVREILVDSGTGVAKGDVLIRLDTDVERTQLRAARSAVELAQIAFKRAKRLIKTRNVSQADYDTAKINLDRANAEVDNIRAIIAKKTLRAPFSGRLGITRVSVGQFLDKGSIVVSLQSLEPIYVDFSVPQQRLRDISRGLNVEIRSDAYPDRMFPGTLTAINPDIDPATRYIRVQATLANADGALRPGMFVQVETTLDHSDEVLVIPETAVVHAPYGDSIYIIEEKEGQKTIRQQFIRLGDRRGDFVVVLDGIAEDTEIVSTGVFKLNAGIPVVIDNTLAPDFSFEPKPDNS